MLVCAPLWHPLTGDPSRAEELNFDSFAMVLLKLHGNAGAVHEDDLPVAYPFFEEGRFQPILLRGTGGVGNATFVDVSNPSGVAANVDVGFGHVPLVALARSMLGLDEGHNAVSVESGTSIKNVKA